MPYSEELAERVREVFITTDPAHADVVEKKMFGGLCFIRRGHMCCGILEERLMLRLDKELTAGALEEANTHPMDFTGRTIKSMLYVDEEGIDGKRALKKWVKRAVAFNDTQKPK
jgi:TfoX/Sxy family transcriptional regulator of competence genes